MAPNCHLAHSQKRGALPIGRAQMRLEELSYALPVLPTYLVSRRWHVEISLRAAAGFLRFHPMQLPSPSWRGERS